MLNKGDIYTTENAIVIVVENYNYYEFSKEKLNEYNLPIISNKLINDYISKYFYEISAFDFEMFVYETDIKKFNKGYLGKLTDENLKKILENAYNF